MTSRTVLRLSGADTHEFLQGLVSNDVARSRDGLVYAALLTPQGKYLADFMILADGDDLLLDCDAAQGDALARRLGMYRLRADVAIAVADIPVRRGIGTGKDTGAMPEGAFADPRHPGLGWRAYGQDPAPQDDRTDWDALRVAHCIPASGIELTPDTFILEAGFERLNGVDFRKGCYVGQEVTARMKHKTTLRKGLTRVRVEGAAPVGTPILAQGKAAGTLFTQAGGYGIAYMRHDRAAPEMQAGQASVYPAEPLT